MQRRGLVLGVMGGAAGCAAGSALPARAQARGLPVPPSGELRFQILRNGTPVGEHHLYFTQNGNRLRVDLAAALVVRIAGIPVFHYKADACEHWEGGQFCGVASKVDHNGARLQVLASPIADGFAIASTKAGDYDYTGSPPMMPLTYWNKAMLESMILNIETGRHYPAIVKSPGWNYLTSAEGERLVAQRFDISGKLHLSVWYDQYGQWAGLQFYVDGDVTFRKFVT